MLLRISVSTVVILILTACSSGGGDGSRRCDEALTVSYIENKFANGFPGITESNTTIVHDDGNQGNTHDIGVVAVSQTHSSYGDSLAFSYSVYGTAAPPADAYLAFFIDTDRNMATGMMVGSSMGADALIVNAAGGDANGFYLWDGSGWTIQPTMGITSSSASYYQGCTHSTIIYAPLYTGLSSLYSTAVTGIVMGITVSGSSPNNITSILDSSSQFDFTIP